MTPYYLKMKEYWRVLNKARRDHAEARRHVGTVQRVDVSSKAHCSLAPRVANNESCSHPKGD